jgi:hypothetical protein
MLSKNVEYVLLKLRTVINTSPSKASKIRKNKFIIHFLLCDCQTWYLTSADEHALQVSDARCIDLFINLFIHSFNFHELRFVEVT